MAAVHFCIIVVVVFFLKRNTNKKCIIIIIIGTIPSLVLVNEGIDPKWNGILGRPRNFWVTALNMCCCQ